MQSHRGHTERGFRAGPASPLCWGDVCSTPIASPGRIRGSELSIQAPSSLPALAGRAEGAASIWWAISLAICRHRSKRCLLAMCPVFLKSQKPISTGESVCLPAGCCPRLSPRHLSPSSLSHLSSNAATDYQVGPRVDPQRANLSGPGWRFLQDPPQPCDVLGKSPASSASCSHLRGVAFGWLYGH